MKADVLREKFLSFFEARKHKIVESDSLVPKDDPTVLFTPAGMNQFKKEFLGFDSGFKRAATSQRCLRTDDLDKVGKTSNHHTFFEMLGNFSFGDYFKEEAIAWAWEFLVGQLKIPREKLWVSVYKDDPEAYRIWLEQVKIPAERIIKLGDKENFWPSEAKEKGPNGPCGPCSEIFFDQGKERGCQKSGCTPACNCARFVEVWNLVFTQFNRKVGGLLEPLPNKNIDTGMGLERLAAVMQGVYTNFETDLFAPLIKEITSAVKSHPENEKELTSGIADHLRAITFAIYDGVLPSNEGRGYVIRKLIRKGTYNLMMLGLAKPFLYKLVPVLSEVMRLPYPELEGRRENIAEIILAEEKNFISILNSSDKFFKAAFSDSGIASEPKKAAALTFELYDTHGLPIELTKEWLKKTFNAEVSVEELKRKIDEQKNRSKAQSAMTGDVFSLQGLDARVLPTCFSGYKDNTLNAAIIRIVQPDMPLEELKEGQEAGIILDKTPFYPESGGQVGDIGTLVKGENIFEVLDTQKTGKIIIHRGRVKRGSFKNEDSVSAKINLKHRLSVARNHTATHLLQAALRKVLGTHIKQQGSLVAAERLRFDFAHFKDLSEEELNRVEELVNRYIIDNRPVKTKEMPLAEAKQKGALAFFGEKYEDEVRVVSVDDLSQELCGGTHLNSTGEIGLFRITSESSISSGTRRIEAVTAEFAYKITKDEEKLLTEVASSLGVGTRDVAKELEKRLSQLKDLEKRLAAEKLNIARASAEALLENASTINQVKFISGLMNNADMDLLRKSVDLIKEKTDNAFIALGSSFDSRALLVLGITPDLCKRYPSLDASSLIREVSSYIGGSGGGREDFAQAGGSKPENLENALKELKNIILEANLK